MKQLVHIYNDKEGIFGFVSEIPEKPKPDEFGFYLGEWSGKSYTKALEKIKSSAIRFKDQEQITEMVLKTLLIPVLTQDTFYSIELEGYEVVFEDSDIVRDVVDLGLETEVVYFEQVAILKPVASQKDSPSKEEPVKTAEDYFKERYAYFYYEDKAAKSAQRFDFYNMIDFADQYASQFKSSKEQELQKVVLDLSETNTDLLALLNEADDLFCSLEDTAHGEEGKRITEIRGKIQNIFKYNPPSTVNEKE